MMSLNLAPPPDQQFASYDDLLSSLHVHVKVHSYAVAVGRSKQNKKGKMKIYYLQCVKSGKVRDRVTDRLKPLVSQKTDCPFRCRAQYSEGTWFLTINKPDHNYQPEAPIFHYQHCIFPNHIKGQVASMSRAGITSKQIASIISQSHTKQI
jgi:hypothetical protein